MCWESYNKPIKKKAEKDIAVFKIITRDFKSYYRSYKYKLNHTYRTRIGQILHPTLYTFSIFEGFHSYSKECEITRYNNSFNLFPKKVKMFEVRSKCNKKFRLDAFQIEKVLKVNCIIPKGSLYYENEDGEIVSSSIRIVRVLDLVNTNNIEEFINKREIV